MQEAKFLNDPEYAKMKKEVSQAATCCCATTKIDDKCKLGKFENEWLEREKERHFQTLFKELWPNIHAGRIDEPTEAQKIAAEIEKNRKLNEMLLEQEIVRIKAKKEEEKMKESPLPSIYSSIYTPRCHDALNISINGLPSTSGQFIALEYDQAVKQTESSKAIYLSKMNDYTSLRLLIEICFIYLFILEF